MKIYIAGPMTSLPEYNYPAFLEAEHRIKLLYRHEVLNPATIEWDDGGVQGSLPYRDYIAGGIRLLLEADAIALLPNWGASKGARLEREIAEAMGMAVFYYTQSPNAALTSQEPRGQFDR